MGQLHRCVSVPKASLVTSPTRKETSYSDRRLSVSYILFIIIIGGILVLFIYITRLASKETFSPSNKIHQEVGRAKDLSAPLYGRLHHGQVRTGFGQERLLNALD